jgi:hypothetical protein
VLSLLYHVNRAAAAERAAARRGSPGAQAVHGETRERGPAVRRGTAQNDKDNENTSDLGYGMFILRAETRAEAEAIAFQEPNTNAGLRTMKVVPWARGEGDIQISISFTNGTVKIDRRTYLLDNG